MKITTIELPLYFLDIVIVIGDWNLVSKKFKLPFTEEEYKVCAWTLYDEPYLSGNEIFILLKPEHLDYNILCHELFHCISGVCKLRGIKMDSDNDEPLTYLQGYIGEKLFEFRDKYIKDEQAKTERTV